LIDLGSDLNILYKLKLNPFYNSFFAEAIAINKTLNHVWPQS